MGYILGQPLHFVFPTASPLDCLVFKLIGRFDQLVTAWFCLVRLMRHGLDKAERKWSCSIVSLLVPASFYLAELHCRLLTHSSNQQFSVLPLDPGIPGGSRNKSGLTLSVLLPTNTLDQYQIRLYPHLHSTPRYGNVLLRSNDSTHEQNPTRAERTNRESPLCCIDLIDVSAFFGN